MKTLKNILLSLLISLIISAGIVSVQIFIESSEIAKKVNRHFYSSDCIFTLGYSDIVIGCEKIMSLTKLNKINSMEFKVELCEVEFNKKSNGFDNEFIAQQIDQLQDAIIREYLDDCIYRKEESNFIVNTARDIESHDRLGVSLEEFNSYYDYRYYHIDIHNDDWHKDESITENSFIKAFIYKTNYFTYFKLDKEEILYNILVITGIGTVIIFIIFFIFKKKV